VTWFAHLMAAVVAQVKPFGEHGVVCGARPIWLRRTVMNTGGESMLVLQKAQLCIFCYHHGILSQQGSSQTLFVTHRGFIKPVHEGLLSSCYMLAKHLHEFLTDSSHVV
jgi:hypothetical protein